MTSWGLARRTASENPACPPRLSTGPKSTTILSASTDSGWPRYRGGRHSLNEINGLTRAIASRGYRVIVHDRRNCGRSSLDFNTLELEDDVWVEDLNALLSTLDVARAFVVGKSKGAHRHPFCPQSSRQDTRPRAVGLGGGGRRQVPR